MIDFFFFFFHTRDLCNYTHDSCVAGTSVHGAMQICRFRLSEMNCAVCRLQRSDKRQRQLVRTSGHLPNWPVWLHRNRLHAPLLQRKSALTSSTQVHALSAPSLRFSGQQTM